MHLLLRILKDTVITLAIVLAILIITNKTLNSIKPALETRDRMTAVRTQSSRMAELENKSQENLSDQEKNELKQLRDSLRTISFELHSMLPAIKARSLFASWFYIIIGLLAIIAGVFINNFTVSLGFITAGLILSYIGIFVYDWNPEIWSSGMRSQFQAILTLAGIEVMLVLYKLYRMCKQKIINLVKLK